MGKETSKNAKFLWCTYENREGDVSYLSNHYRKSDFDWPHRSVFENIFKRSLNLNCGKWRINIWWRLLCKQSCERNERAKRFRQWNFNSDSTQSSGGNFHIKFNDFFTENRWEFSHFGFDLCFRKVWEWKTEEKLWNGGKLTQRLFTL